MHWNAKTKRRSIIVAATLLILYFLPLAGLWPWQLWHGWCSVEISSRCQDVNLADPAPSFSGILRELQRDPRLKLEKVGLLTHDTVRHFTFTGKVERSPQSYLLCCYVINDPETRAAVERWHRTGRPLQGMRPQAKADFPDWWPEQGAMYLFAQQTAGEFYWLARGDTARFYRLFHRRADGALVMD